MMSIVVKISERSIELVGFWYTKYSMTTSLKNGRIGLIFWKISSSVYAEKSKFCVTLLNTKQYIVVSCSAYCCQTPDSVSLCLSCISTWTKFRSI